MNCRCDVSPSFGATPRDCRATLREISRRQFDREKTVRIIEKKIEAIAPRIPLSHAEATLIATRLEGVRSVRGAISRRSLMSAAGREGAHAVLLRSKADPWLASLRTRKHRLVVAVALAITTARITQARSRAEGIPTDVPQRQRNSLSSGTAGSLREDGRVMANRLTRRIERTGSVSGAPYSRQTDPARSEVGFVV
jgi:hypothetical protein